MTGKSSPPHPPRAAVGFAVFLLFMTPPAGGVPRSEVEATTVWRRLGSVGAGAETSIALAQSSSGDIAVGDDAGVTWWRRDERYRAVLPSVRDLAFDSENVLWVATDRGLFAWTRSGRPIRRRLSGGEAGNRVARIAVSGSSLLLATGSGALWSSQGKIFQRLGTSAAVTSVSHVAIRAARFDQEPGASPGMRAGIAQAWIYGPRGLSVIRGLEAASGLRVTGVDTLPIPLPSPGLSEESVRPGESLQPGQSLQSSESLPPDESLQPELSLQPSQRGVVDLVIDPEGRRLYLVFEKSIAWRSIAERGASRYSGPMRSIWHRERPTLPPGTSIRSLGWAAGRVWVATDHGVLSAETLSGPFQRAASPVGTTNCIDVQARVFDRALVLCRAGLFALGDAWPEAALTTSSAIPPEFPIPSPELLADPPLSEIRRRALTRAGLTVGRADSMWRRLRRRAYWPELQLSFDVDVDSDREFDFDEAYVSGATRSLVDRTRDEGRTYRASIELDWDLGNVVYPDETVDLSRELRQIISLRDGVVDEINQLYFERQAIRASLVSARPDQDNEIIRLTWRARELDAGLDAWTGGWISRWRAQPLPPVDPNHEHGSARRPEWPHPDDP